MANRRMFSKNVVETDRFLDMPFSAQALYFHFGMVADDDGFVSNPRGTTRLVGAKDSDMAALVMAGFVILFDSGVVVITDWNENNYIQSDRHHATKCVEEMAVLERVDGRYALPACIQPVYNLDTDCIQPVSNLDTEVRLGKDRIGKDNSSYNSSIPVVNPKEGQDICASTEVDAPAATGKKRGRFVPPTLEELTAYCKEKGYTFSPERFIAHYESNGWKVGRNPMKSWKSACVTWQGDSPVSHASDKPVPSLDEQLQAYGI